MRKTQPCQSRGQHTPNNRKAVTKNPYIPHAPARELGISSLKSHVK